MFVSVGFILLLSYSPYVNTQYTESDLRQKIFLNYNSDNRPVLDYNDTVTTSFGIELISLEEFDQVGEKVKFNFQMKYTWYDEYLKWNRSVYNNKFITVNPENVWRPDLELYNSANKPEKVSGEGILKIFNTGHIYWIIPVIYDYSCPLNLKKFPFDTQTCKMTFGSWKLSKNYLNISTLPLPIQNRTDTYHSNTLFEPVAFDKFKHNEWNIINMTSHNENLEYLCCPDELWTITEIDIIMERNYHKYIVVIIMTFFLTLSALTVVLFMLERYIRTYLLVFIPLSIIWLQLYISSKIPVIEYSTKMETFIQLSYYISMLSAIYSGIMYNLAVGYFPYLKWYFQYSEFKKFNDKKYEKLTYITKKDNEELKNYYVFQRYGRLLYNIDNFLRFSFYAIYIGYTISIIA